MNKIDKHECSECGHTDIEDNQKVKVLSVMYRPKYNTINSFKQIKVCKCGYLLTIIHEQLDCQYE